MDWNKIKHNKKACDLLLAHYDVSEYDSWMNDLLLSRGLYDFFDEQGIYVFMLKGGLDAWFDPRIAVKGQKEQWCGVGVNNRKEAEEEAFERAFEILNDKLNNDGD